MARPLKPINEDQVGALASIGCTMEEIGSILGCSVNTLERRFGDVIEKGRSNLRMSLRREQVRLALGGDRTMLIWLGKQLLGQRDTQQMEHSGGVEIKIIDESGS